MKIRREQRRSQAPRTARAAIRRQISKANPEEFERLLRILRRAALLDRQLADLHLRWPAIEIRFYGVSRLGDTEYGVAPRRLLRALRRWRQ